MPQRIVHVLFSYTMVIVQQKKTRSVISNLKTSDNLVDIVGKIVYMSFEKRSDVAYTSYAFRRQIHTDLSIINELATTGGGKIPMTDGIAHAF